MNCRTGRICWTGQGRGAGRVIGAWTTPQRPEDSYASTLLSRGVWIKVVADWLGHASPVVTLSTYAHLMPADDDVARGVLDAAFTRSADSWRSQDVAGA
jgi:integrase